MNPRLFLTVLLPFPLLVACGGSDSDASPSPGGAGQPDEPGGQPGGEPGVTKSGRPTFNAQDGWIVETPSSAMRLAQYSLPKVEGDAEDASLVVFNFPGGGSVQDNVARWAGQFAATEGENPLERAKIEVKDLGEWTLTTFDLSGHYQAETMPGSGERVDKPKTRMMAAIVETPTGMYFAKLVGPVATVGKWEQSFHAFVDAM